MNNLNRSNLICSSVAEPSISAPPVMELPIPIVTHPTERNSAYGRVHPTDAVGCIDKLGAITPEALEDDVLEHLRFISRPTFSKKGRNIRGFPHERWKIWLDIHPDGTVYFSTNPSHFSRWSLLRETLTRRLGDWTLQAKIRVLHCTATVPESFNDVFMGCDFGRKRFVERYRDTVNGRSVYIGRKGFRNEMIIYDKRKQSRTLSDSEDRIDYECTRFEINSILHKGMTVAELPELVNHRPFKHIKRNTIRFIEPTRKTYREGLKFGEFKQLCEREGFFMARRTLHDQCNRNFQVNYGHLFELIPIRQSFDDIFMASMEEFFGPYDPAHAS